MGSMVMNTLVIFRMALLYMYPTSVLTLGSNTIYIIAPRTRSVTTSPKREDAKAAICGRNFTNIYPTPARTASIKKSPVLPSGLPQKDFGFGNDPLKSCTGVVILRVIKGFVE